MTRLRRESRKLKTFARQVATAPKKVRRGVHVNRQRFRWQQVADPTWLGAFLVLLVSIAGCKGKDSTTIGERFDFEKVTAVLVYDVDPIRIPECWKNLDDVTVEEFDISLFKDLLSRAHHVRDGINKPMWKGASLAIVRFSDDRELRLALSYYGSFFTVLGEKGHYGFAGDRQAAEQWKKEFQMRIVHGCFIPRRQ